MIKKILNPKLEFILRYIRSFIKFIPDYIYDLHRYSKYSINNNTPFDNEGQLIARITGLYHVIEKGLTMPKTNLGFGTKRIKELIRLLKVYEKTVYNNLFFINF